MKYRGFFLCISESLLPLHIKWAFLSQILQNKGKTQIYLNHKNSIQHLLDILSCNTMKSLIRRTSNINKPLWNNLKLCIFGGAGGNESPSYFQYSGNSNSVLTSTMVSVFFSIALLLVLLMLNP